MIQSITIINIHYRPSFLLPAPCRPAEEPRPYRARVLSTSSPSSSCLLSSPARRGNRDNGFVFSAAWFYFQTCDLLSSLLLPLQSPGGVQGGAVPPGASSEAYLDRHLYPHWSLAADVGTRETRGTDHRHSNQLLGCFGHAEIETPLIVCPPHCPPALSISTRTRTVIHDTRPSTLDPPSLREQRNSRPSAALSHTSFSARARVQCPATSLPCGHRGPSLPPQPPSPPRRRAPPLPAHKETTLYSS